MVILTFDKICPRWTNVLINGDQSDWLNQGNWKWSIAGESHGFHAYWCPECRQLDHEFSTCVQGAAQIYEYKITDPAKFEETKNAFVEHWNNEHQDLWNLRNK